MQERKQDGTQPAEQHILSAAVLLLLRRRRTATIAVRGRNLVASGAAAAAHIQRLGQNRLQLLQQHVQCRPAS